MKYLNLLILLTMTALFTACSEDESFNSNKVTVGFISDTYSVRENAKNINIPIAVKGQRNGKVSITVIAEEYGSNPAKEYVSLTETGHYTITDKTLDVQVDDQMERTVNVQVSPIDNDKLNGDRTLKLTIIKADGAEITTDETIVTIIDDENAIYERFAGKWHLSGILANDNESEEPFSKEITIAATTDETKPEYNNILSALGLEMLNVGFDINVSWHFRYTFDSDTKTGTLGFICGETVASYTSVYSWDWASYDGHSFSTDDITATWSLNENDEMPTEIVFPEDSELYLRRINITPEVWWKKLSQLKLTR